MKTTINGKLAFFVAMLLALVALTKVRSMDLPGGLDMDKVTELSVTLDKCNGALGDIVSLYMVDADPLIKKVQEELKEAKDADRLRKRKEREEERSAKKQKTSNEDGDEATAQSKNTVDAIEAAEDMSMNKTKGDAMANAVLNILDSNEWDTFMDSSTLQKVSDELNLTCVMQDETFVDVFQGIMGSQNITEDHHLYPVISKAPEIVSGYYSCGGRIVPVLEFAEGVAPDVVKGDQFDPMSILNSPSFAGLVGSGFDMACFFGVPAVSDLVGQIMG